MPSGALNHPWPPKSCAAAAAAAQRSITQDNFHSLLGAAGLAVWHICIRPQPPNSFGDVPGCSRCCA